METIRSIYGKSRDNVYERELAKLAEDKIEEQSKELIRRYQDALFSKGCGKIRVSKLSSQLRKVSALLDKPLDDVDQNDMSILISGINRDQDYAEATKGDYRRCLKQFYAWFEEQDGRLKGNNEQEIQKAQRFYKFLNKEVKASYRKRLIDPSTIITKQDIDTVVSNGCCSIKEKALVKFLHETGVRAGELLNMKIKDIVFSRSYAEVIVNGKTGMRKIPIVSSIQYLVAWLGVHPRKDDDSAYVWLGENRKIMHMPMQHRGVQKMIDRCFDRALIKKKHNLHWFRHSRATLLAPKLPEALLCKYMGWTLGSRQIKTYVHLCTEQLQDAYLMLNNIKPKNENGKESIICGCGSANDSIARYCHTCGRPLNVEIAIQDKEMMKTEMDKSVQLLLEIAKDPELMKAFEEFRRRP